MQVHSHNAAYEWGQTSGQARKEGGVTSGFGRGRGVGAWALLTLVCGIGTGCGGVLPGIGQPPERVEQFSVDPALPRCQGSTDTGRDCVVLVNFQSDPWVDVFLDAQYVGRTPLLDVRVKARTYKLRLYNPEIKLDYSYDKQFNPISPEDKIDLSFNPQ